MEKYDIRPSRTNETKMDLVVQDLPHARVAIALEWGEIRDLHDFLAGKIRERDEMLRGSEPARTALSDSGNVSFTILEDDE